MVLKVKDMRNTILYIFFLGYVLSSSAQEILPIGDEDCFHGTGTLFYQDYDRDGKGNPLVSLELCNPSLGWVLDNSDCDDRDPNIKGPKNWYLDSDNDGQGAGSLAVRDCNNPSTSTVTYVDNNNDCDDTDPTITVKTAYYLDGDKDGQAAVNSAPRYECEDPSTATVKYVTSAYRTDCDDTNPNVQQITWYRDDDGDGFGEKNYSITRCSKPGDDFYPENLDRCPGVNGSENGCPPAGSNFSELWNTVKVTGYDVTGRTVAKSKAYYDELGKSVQTQTKDFKTGKTWASETLYDTQGRAAVQTLSAPTNADIPTDFIYRNGFTQKQDGSEFGNSDFENDPENPALVGDDPNTVGWYYSTNNTSEPYQDVTQRPYSRTIYSELNPGAALKTIGGNRIDGQWKNGYSFSMPAGEELSSSVAFGSSWNTAHKVIKTVSRDVHGVENVVFTNTDGNALAAARSGNEQGNTTVRNTNVYIREQGFVDVHVPKGTTGVQLYNISGVALDIYNLITEKKMSTAATSLPNGFYRIAVRNLDSYNANNPIRVQCKENYYDYSLNYYDKAGRLLRSKQPLHHLESTYSYNSFGQLEHSHSPDEGDAWFLYRRDGQIRFSVNSKQLDAKQFSYTNYDHRGRPVESGVYNDTTTPVYIDPTNTSDPFKAALRNLIDQNDGLTDANCSEQIQTQYDDHDNSGLAAAFGSDTRKSNYAKQNFVVGSVAKTSNDQTTTWYSYDVYGRVAWVVQKIQGLTGVKTIDYQYDPVTSQVHKVYYQKGASDQFVHRYTYDAINFSLIKVETSTNDSSYTEHASYEYYETGALKRTNIARGLQGIDYVYNLGGALKSINHPSLSGSHDPGGDATDLFGMIIDYHNYDYNRPKRNIKSASYGVDQYNGNIKGIRWSSSYNPVAGKEHTYSYGYNRNNWLENANYGHFTGDYSSLPVITEGEEGTADRDDYPTSDVINSGESKNYLANNSITMGVGFHAKPGSTVSAKISGMGATHNVNAGSLAINNNGDYKVDNLTYDANGNIQSLDRNKHTANGSNAMDQLEYEYYDNPNVTPYKPNQLKQVIDHAGDVAGADDIDSQGPNNYVYNEIGQLIENKKENILYFYNATGLVTEIKKGNQPVVKFFYNDKNHRVKKEAYNLSTGALSYTEHYVRDASGTAMAIYRNGQALEHTIYGSGRLGVYKRSGGKSLYQLTDHLGNVRAVVQKDGSGNAIALTATDYYPFGMGMPGRKISDKEYRHTYQGQEQDEETGKEAFELRLWDARIGRWLTTDPYRQFDSPYLGMGNNPVRFIDPDGGYCEDAQGNHIPCPDGYSYFEGPTENSALFVNGRFWGEILPEISLNSNSNAMALNDNGFSLNQNITMDPISGLVNGRPDIGEIQAIILHRTVSSNYPGGWMKTKTKTKGAHFFIDKDGTTYQTASMDKSVAHIYSSSSKQMYPEYYGKLLNTNTVGIEVIGNYNKATKEWEPLTVFQAVSVSILVDQLSKHYDIHRNQVYPHETVQRKTTGEGQTVLDVTTFFD